MTKKQRFFKKIIDMVRSGVTNAKLGNFSIEKESTNVWIRFFGHTFGLFDGSRFFLAEGAITSDYFEDYDEAACDIFWSIVSIVGKRYGNEKRKTLRQQTEYSPMFF